VSDNPTSSDNCSKKNKKKIQRQGASCGIPCDSRTFYNYRISQDSSYSISSSATVVEFVVIKFVCSLQH